MNHDHPDPARLTFGCPACIQTAEEARWTYAPLKLVSWRATVPTWVLESDDGEPIEWTFTSHTRIPDDLDWRSPDGAEQIDYGRFDIGAEMAAAMPKFSDERATVTALCHAAIYITAVRDIPAESEPQPQLFKAAS